ncbi:hypothetical protein DBV08_27960 [Rhodococcus sp. KBW08]|uniref:5-methylcytosine restriction system specificity protein McrC n=1 Tax=Rhodococcus sp. KBW08 TaxID=2144188 RepID=UPI000F5A4778|nr:hypothetical protein [Rhodococcus sp. KBW08]RQO42938.1 hypothetical protein DBV08_27960 [Rhodococcus sp. KBW08]
MSITVSASPRGARVGIVATGNADAQALITVAPKMWRPPGTPRLQTVGPDDSVGRHFDIALYETDRIQVDEPRALESIVENYLCQTISNSDNEPAEGLLQPSVNLPGEYTPTSANKSNTTDLLRLFDKLDLLRPDDAELDATTLRSPLHRPLVYRRLLDEVSRRLNNARRGYREVSRVHSTIRGRADPRSINLHLQTGSPHVLCHYSELTESTTLLGIICSALDFIADGLALNSPFDGNLSTSRLRHDAIGLRRILSEVTSVSIRAALHEGPRLRLNRLDQQWSQALSIALAVLSQVELVSSQVSTHHTETFELSIRTDKLWERIIEHVALKLGFDLTLNQRQINRTLVVDPWIDVVDQSNPRTYPDVLAVDGDQLWIIDAKYKQRDVASSPSRDDQYQLFAYSHLASHPHCTTTLAVLIYPGLGEMRTWTRGGDDDATLYACSIPFPQPQDVRNAGDWEQYLCRSANLLGTQLNRPSPQ